MIARPCMCTYSPLLDLYRTDAANDFFFTLTELPALSRADFNLDGAVDSVDLTIWTTNFGRTTDVLPQQGDADVDGDVDGADYLVWQQQFTGALAAAASHASVPEPSTLPLAAAASLMAFSRRRRSHVC